MRRFFSITTIAVLICSAASPLLAASCPHSQPAMACHGTKAQHSHCATMHHHQTPDAAPDSDLAKIQSAQAPASCPMDCCASGHPQSIAVATAMSILPSLVEAEASLHSAPFVFINSGFSSHTDRGPPAL